MRAEIVTTGTELLLGQIDDTNATYLARQLRDLGIDLFFRTTVGDNERRIAQALDIALSRADLIITTGGLGPTVDDVTREAVSRVTRLAICGVVFAFLVLRWVDRLVLLQPAFFA